MLSGWKLKSRPGQADLLAAGQQCLAPEQRKPPVQMCFHLQFYMVGEMELFLASTLLLLVLCGTADNSAEIQSKSEQRKAGLSCATAKVQ